ncbi:MAG TPA: hypothetical protein VMW52_06090, partial [Phycisphaerae bacterium]|nr:hypothetical protein [Phycisphaerae bacterium]
GVHRHRPHLGRDNGIHNKRPVLQRGGYGIHRTFGQIPDISGDGGATGRRIHAKYTTDLQAYMQALAARLRRVRVCCGDWARICTKSPTTYIGITAVFLDPPYGAEDRADCYSEDSRTVAADVQAWCIEQGDNPKLRIALCGYEGEHAELEALGWDTVAWKASGGYANQGTQGNANRHRERIWFSPHCLRLDRPQQLALFAGDAA